MTDDRPQFPLPGKDPSSDTASVLKFYKLPSSFPAAVIKEAAQVDPSVKVGSGRIDLRDRFVFTCDPVTARDYDDALSIRTDRRGNRELGVHIADVSHYVRPGSALDREAKKRSTSVYFCDRVVPMLPESLCNGVCSLRPGEDRYAFSVFMTFDRHGRMTGRRFAKSVVRSRRRFTYEQVMTILANPGKGGGKSPGIALSASERRAVCAIGELALQLRRIRISSGALDIEIPEAEAVLDSGGELSRIEARPYDESHQMIEECMVAANEAVACELWTRGIKILSRLHERPDGEKLDMLRAELRSLGIRPGNLADDAVFAGFLASVKKHPLYPVIAMMILRSMKKAVYDSSSIGHYGLAKKHYAHFTSPIRRYPDLLLHRQLSRYLSGGNAKMPPRELARNAAHATEAEQVAAEAERALLEIKKYRLLEKQLSSGRIEDYDAVVVKCAPFGCFVEIPEIAVSGLVHVSELSSRYVRFNSYDQSLSAPGSKGWRIGDKMRVRVVNVDMRARRIDFTPSAKRRGRSRRVSSS